MTYCFPTEEIAMNKLTLLPIGIGVLIAEALDKAITAFGGSTISADMNKSSFCSSSKTITRPTVKWPNDVLLDGRKVAGTLIESYRIQCGQDGTGKKLPDGDYWLMVGIGVNLESYPTMIDCVDTKPNPNAKIVSTTVADVAVPVQPPPRAAISLRQHCYSEQQQQKKKNYMIPNPVSFGTDLSFAIERLVQDELSSKGNNIDRQQRSSAFSSSSSSSFTSDHHHENHLRYNLSSPLENTVVDRWRSWSKLGVKYVLRDTGETVETVDIEADGRLRVIGSDGKERTLASDYFM
jgi:biotin-(acetyl-CoA carboxylase) ligase